MSFLKKYPTLFMGLGIMLLFLMIGFLRLDFLDAIEFKFFDARMSMRIEPDTTSEIVIVDIDNDSIEKLGRWPWHRSLIAKGIEKISIGVPKVIGLNFIYSEPEESSGILALADIEKQFIEAVPDIEKNKTLSPVFQAVKDAQNQLDHDAKLAHAIQTSGKVVLPVFFKHKAFQDKQGNSGNSILKSQAISNVREYEGLECATANEITMPITDFLKVSQGIGHINFVSDPDGILRREQLFYEYDGLYIPSYTLKLASLYLNIPNDEINADIGMAVYLGPFKIPTTVNSELLVSFKGPSNSFKKFSFFDVVNDKIPPSVFKDKIVIVSPSAAGLINPLSTPTDTFMPLGEFSANTIWTILNQKFIQEPGWSFIGELLMITFCGLLITFILPRQKAMIAGFTFLGFLVLMIGGSTYLFVSKGLWIQVTYPLIELVLGYIGIVSIKYFITETGKEKVEGESAETNRMLGISFQEQGMLDMAFDKFRKVPVDDQMKDILYNLGLDYERKRQLNKAASVYEYIEEYDKKFKDAGDRKKKLMQASDTMVFGDGFLGGGADNDNLVSTGTDTRPTLGRYEVIKQLGKGAMGIVYLGQDPRINRTTAIKTVKFADDFEEEEAEKMKEKFFREAESAGTLSHPNIVTIYDAGDEKDIAYIAMEYLEGDDLEKYTKKGNLLPMRTVIDYVADIADGLSYAHEKGIVHRDIKPANIMLIKSGEIKITDFGIAKISASSQTKTGVVKGTPFYMSPEQISGKKVDGRSDIFSLGVMLFQLLTGKVPFTGDSPAALMHQILNEPHPNPKDINPKIAKPLVMIIDKTLEKDRKKRYQKAISLANHLRELGKKIDAVAKKKKE